MALTVSQAPLRQNAPPPPPPPPPPRKEVDAAVRQPALHPNQPDAPPPERYVQHEVESGENLTEVSRRYQTTVPMLEAANPQLAQSDQIEVGQKLNVPIGADYGREPTRDVVEPGQTLTDLAREHPDVTPQDIARANRLAQQIEVGLCWINAWFLRDLRTPFGGSKQSGIGREGGVHSLEFYTELRNVMVKF